MDPITPFVAAAVAKGVSDGSSETAKTGGALLLRLFGPSADVIGESWADRLRQTNMDRLLRKTEARAKAREGLGQDPGFANPRVASRVFEDAQYADGDVVSEYLSGVLASSRTSNGGSDAGIAWASVVARLSSDHLKLHYLVYTSARRVSMELGVAHINELHGTEVVVPLGPVVDALEAVDVGDALNEAVAGLMREGLVGEGFRSGLGPHVLEQELAMKPGAQSLLDAPGGLRVSLTVHGIRMFVWGNGCGSLGGNCYLDSTVDLLPADRASFPTIPFAQIPADLVTDPPAAAQ